MATGLAAAAYDDSGRGQARRGDGIGLAFEVYGPLAAKATEYHRNNSNDGDGGAAGSGGGGSMNESMRHSCFLVAPPRRRRQRGGAWDCSGGLRR